MFRPVKTGHDQFDGGGIHCMNRTLEAAQRPSPAPRKARLEVLQMLHHFPKKLLGQRGLSLAIGVGESVPTRRRSPAYRAQFTGVQAQPIARVVEAEAMCQLHVDQRYHMTPRTITASLSVD